MELIDIIGWLAIGFLPTYGGLEITTRIFTRKISTRIFTGTNQEKEKIGG
ncbi:MAG TPA: hypothetical protein VF884_08855 [Nitrososphaeraceae archaeon]